MYTRFTGALFLLLAASAVYGQRYDSYGRPYDRDGRYDRRYDGYRGSDAVNRTLDDLSRARSYLYTDHHERKHFDKAQSELLKFQDRWARGHFDNGRLDEAIENVQHLVNADRVSPRDREILRQDLFALREFRSTRGRFDGGRDPYYRR